MIDFVGRSRSPLDDMQQWNQYFGDQATRAHNEWQQNELRQRYDEANRYSREGAMSDAAFQHANGDVFQSGDAAMAGLAPAEPPAHPAATAANVGIAAVTSAARGRSPAELMVGRPLSQSRSVPIVNNVSTDLPLEARIYTAQELRSNPALQQRIRDEIQAGNVRLANTLDFRSFTQGRIPARGIRVLTNNRSTGARDMYTDTVNVRDQVGTPSARAPIPAPVAGEGPPLDVNAPNPDDNGAPINLDEVPGSPPNPPSGLEPPDAQGNFNSSQNVSRVIRPTREMRILETTVQDNLRRADIAARHGDRAGAQAAFGNALQAQAAYTQQYRMGLYQAARSGNQAAMGELLSEFNIQASVDSNGNWTNGYGTSMSRQALLSDLQNLVDAAGATARTEAARQIMEAQINAGARMYEADTQHRSAILRAFTDVQIAQMSNAAKAAIANGDAHVTINQSDGTAFLTYSITDAHGNQVPQMEVIRPETVSSPSTQGNRNTQVYTRTPVQNNARATGTVGATPQ